MPCERVSGTQTIALFLIMGVLPIACSDDPERRVLPSTTPDSQRAVETKATKASFAREQDSVKVARGRQLFAQNCASCHGSRAEGAPQWSTPGADGKYPPPPLNGTAHTWHHPTAVLKRTIREGTIALGGKMPPWGGKLSDGDMEAIIAWFQSLWPDEIYDTWARMDAEVSNYQTGQ